MAKTIYDYVQSAALAAYWETKQAEMAEPPFLGDVLFPARKQVGLELKYIKGSKGMPAEMNVSAFDSKTIKRDRVGVSEVKTKMPFFKNEKSVDEETRQKLLMLLQANNDEYIKPLVRNIFDDQTSLVEDASVTREILRMQLISTGTISLANNGQEYLYDYGLSGDQKVTPTIKWDQASADILGDIEKWQDSREDAGYGRPTRAITSRKVMRNMQKNEAIKNALYVFGQGKVAITDAMVKNYIQQQTGVTIEVYEKKYKGIDGKVKRFLPEDLFILIPEGNLGETVFGTTPEEADLMASNKADVSIVDTGVAVTTYEEVDPVNVHTKVSEVVLPSFDMADYIMIGDVLTE